MYLKSIQKNHTFVISCLLFTLLQVVAKHALADSVTAPYKANAGVSSSVGADPTTGISDVYSDIDMRVRLARLKSKKRAPHLTIKAKLWCCAACKTCN
jgi:hypothetical protein